MKEQIKELRVKLDGLAQLTKELKPYQECLTGMGILQQIYSTQSSKEIEKAYDSLILAKAWLGKVLQELGEETPYKNDGKRKTIEDIEPAADKAIEVTDFPIGPDNWGEGPITASHIEKTDWLRQEIEKVVNEIKQIGNAPNPPMLNREISIARTNAYNYLCEARFWLRFELQIIKEQK